MAHQEVKREMVMMYKCPMCGGEVVEREVTRLLQGGNNVAETTVPADVCLEGREQYHFPLNFSPIFT